MEEARVERGIAKVPDGAKVPALVDLTMAEVKKYINPKVTDLEAMTFLNICKAQGLDPFRREIYLIKFGTEDASFVISKDTFLKRAERNKAYRGFQAGLIVATPAGQINYRQGTFYLEQETIMGGWCEVARADRNVHVRNELTIKEYLRKNKYGDPTRPWKEMPGTMIRKAAICASHREAFPDELGHLYGFEEMGITEHDVPAVEYGKPPEIEMPVELKDFKAPEEKAGEKIEPPTGEAKVEGAAPAVEGEAFPAENREPGADENEDVARIPKGAARKILDTGEKSKLKQDAGSVSKGQVGMIGAWLGELGIKADDERHRALSDLLGVEVKSANDLSSAEASAVIDVLKDLRL